MNKAFRKLRFLRLCRLRSLLTALLFAFPLLIPCTAAEKSTRPNILYIMTDDHAAHALSCYGSKINKTPNLDRIATGGMRFDNCFFTNSLCGPSRATLLTGKYSHMNGFRANKPDAKLAGSQVTFPKLL